MQYCQDLITDVLNNILNPENLDKDVPTAPNEFWAAREKELLDAMEDKMQSVAKDIMSVYVDEYKDIIAAQVDKMIGGELAQELSEEFPALETRQIIPLVRHLVSKGYVRDVFETQFNPTSDELGEILVDLTVHK